MKVTCNTCLREGQVRMRGLRFVSLSAGWSFGNCVIHGMRSLAFWCSEFCLRRYQTAFEVGSVTTAGDDGIEAIPYP